MVRSSMINSEVFLRNSNMTVHIYFSENEPVNNTSYGVIGIYIKDADGNEIDGGELDIENKGEDIKNYIEDALNFMDIKETFDEVEIIQ